MSPSPCVQEMGESVVMKKEQKQLIALIVLICMTGLIFVKIIFRAKAPSGGLPAASPGSAEMPKEIKEGVALPTTKVDFFELEEQLKKNRPRLKWVRDPFRFPPKKEIEKTDVEKLNLTGIIYDEGSPIAVINDEIVHEGDEIEGVKVIKIESERVLLEKDGKPYTLELIKWEE